MIRTCYSDSLREKGLESTIPSNYITALTFLSFRKYQTSTLQPPLTSIKIISYQKLPQTHELNSKLDFY